MSIGMDGGTVTKQVLKASAGNVFAARVTNANAALRYFQIHNTATAPTGGAVPLVFFPIPVSGGVMTVGPEFMAGIEACNAGVSWAISTTPTTFTDSATANEHTVLVKYG